MADSAPKRPTERSTEPQPLAEGSDAPTIRPTVAVDSGSGSSRRRHVVLPMPMPGERVDVYLLEADIGAGGMGAVFRALDCRLDRHVALKLLPPEQANDSDVVQRFYQEARAAARLDHENIARVYSIGHEGGFHHIAFEYIEGHSIRQKVEAGGPLTVAETVNYTLQIANALVHAAERGVIHRDIKPSNIVVTPHGRAKLVDMGLARRFERGKDDDDGLTQPGTTLGTFDYISPEQARDPRDVDIRSDLYSLGCTIYHMLTGSPPFPEGTVTQKLLQHQKEPAPDVRASNPEVPADLAAIVSKLMAKERDRRYQSPELLVRDLLTVAGSLGLRSVSPEGLIWMSANPRPSWERHLVWGLPTAVLALVVGWLVWWNQEPEPVSLAPIEPVSLAPAPKRSADGAGTTGFASTVPANENATSVMTPAARGSAEKSLAKELLVKAGEDLDRLIAEAPSGTTLILADEGPYDLRATAADSAARSTPRNLVIRASEGVHPVLRMASGRNDLEPKKRYALIHYRGGRLTLEGLELVVPAAGDSAEVAGVSLEETDLTLRRCLFRRQGDGSSPSRGFALRVENRMLLEDRPPPIVVQDSHFDRELVAIQARGPADIQFRQCTFGPGNPTFWFENDLESAPSPARLGLSRVSVLAGDGPIVRAIHCALTVRAEDSLFAPPQDTTTTLVETDLPDRLEWVGRSDMYARIKTYLQPILGGASSLSIDQFDRWVDDTRMLRELDSRLTEGEVWAHTYPVQMLAARNPSAAFQLDSGISQSPAPGATRGPWGPIPRSSEFLGAIRPQAAAPLAVPVPPRLSPSPESNVPPMPANTAAVPNMPVDDDEVEPGPMERPLVKEPSPSPPALAPSPTVVDRVIGPTTRPTESTRPRASDRPSHAADRSSLVRSSDEFRSAVARPNPSGTTTILLAPNAKLSIPTIRLNGKNRWRIIGARGVEGNRPEIRFTPEPQSDAIGPVLSSLFEVNHATLEIQGVDFVLRSDDLSATTRAAAFSLSQDSRVKLEGCSVTTIGDSVDSSVFTTSSARNAGRASVRVERPHIPAVAAKDCLFRGAGDLIRISRSPTLNAQITNSAVVLSGNLLHTFGFVSAGASVPLIELNLDRLHVLTEQGMIHLESDAVHPALPMVKLDVIDTILTTGRPDRPLVRIDGQEGLDALADQIDWRGRGVLYDGVDIYRRDQSALPGSMPQRFDRASWDLAVGMGDTDSVHGNARLATPADPTKPLWKVLPRDLRLEPTDEIFDSRGPNLDQIVPPDANITSTQ